MSKITIEFTKDQALSTIQALEWAQDFENEAPSSSRNRFYQRIINKIRKQLRG